MGNFGAFINIKGNDLKPKFTSYKAVVSDSYSQWFRAHPNPLSSRNYFHCPASSERKTDGVRQLVDEHDDVAAQPNRSNPSFCKYNFYKSSQQQSRRHLNRSCQEAVVVVVKFLFFFLN